MKKLNNIIVKERPINQPFKWHGHTLITKVPKPDMYSECAYCFFKKQCNNNEAWKHDIINEHKCSDSKRSDKLNVYYEEIPNLH